jgi:hypothetical protein
VKVISDNGTAEASDDTTVYQLQAVTWDSGSSGWVPANETSPKELINTLVSDSDVTSAVDGLTDAVGGSGYNGYSDPVVFSVTVSQDENGFNKYYINGDLKPNLTFEYGRTYEFDLSGVPGEHPFVLSTTERGSPYVTPVGDKLTIDVTSSTPDLYYYCDDHAGMGAEISSIPFGMPDNIDDMVGLMNSLYQGQDEDATVDGVQISSENMDALKDMLENAAINGVDGSIQGLAALTGVNPTTHNLGDGTQTIESIVSREIADGMEEFSNQKSGAPGNKTIDEIFKETIEDTIDEIESYDPDIFSGT